MPNLAMNIMTGAMFQSPDEPTDFPPEAFKEQVFKIQRPLSSNAKDGLSQALVYNQKRNAQFFWPMNELVGVFQPLGNPQKVYVVGKLERREGGMTAFVLTRLVQGVFW